jgi:hypothetical protein
MASALYDKAREEYLAGNYDFDGDDVRAIIVNISGTGTLYTFSAAHVFMTSINAASRIGTPVSLASKTVTGGVADAADTTLVAVSGDSCEAIVLFNEGGGTDATRELIAYIDGISVTPNGGNITIVWDNGANKIFKL